MKNTITAEDVNVVVQNYTNDKSTRVLDYDIGEYSKEKLGYSASHERMNIKFQRSNANESESASFFVKAVPYDVQIQVDVLTGVNGTFLKESNFFRQVILELYENCKFEEWYPKCYLAKKDVIVLADLKTQKYNLIDTLDNILALKSALVSLSQLHGSSILMEDRLNRNSECYVTLNDYYSGMFREILFNHTAGVVKDALCNFFNVSCALAKSFGYDADKFREKAYRIFEIIKQSKTYRNVICHGDLWWNNMMFNDNYKCILFDFQYARYAPLVVDLLQFLHINTTRNFRKNHEIELIEFYHSTLNKLIKDNDTMESVKVPTIEEILAGMNDLRLVGLATACFYFPLILIDPKVAAEYSQNSESYKSFFLDNNVEQLLAYMKIDERFKTRLEEAVIELAEYAD